MIQRLIHKDIINNFHKGKAILIFGARQVGKTTLLKQLQTEINSEILFLNGDDYDVRESLQKINSIKLKAFIGTKKYVFIDEAQRIENIGLAIKIIVDNMPDVQVVATGSSAFELSAKINEALTGRKYEYELFPFSFQELANSHSLFTEIRQLETRLIFGSYPEIINDPENRIRNLKLISNSLLFKDLLVYEKIKKSSKLIKLLQALALQLGSEISYNEIAQLIGLDKNTVERYIDLLEQSFIIFRLNAFNRNIRNELKKSKKIYFYDLGVRNALINNFNSLDLRQDKGELWENYFICERLKYLRYNNFYSNYYFWRTRTQSEIDYLEEHNAQINAFELKYNVNRKAKLPNSFNNAYPNTEFHLVNPDNYFEFLMKNDDILNY